MLVIAYCFGSLDQEAIIVQLVLLIHLTPYHFLCRNTGRILCMNNNVRTYTIKQTIMIQRHILYSVLISLGALHLQVL